MEISNVFAKTFLHGSAQGFMSELGGGDFLQGFASVGVAGFRDVAGSFANSAVGQIGFGALSGGIVAGLNDVLHTIIQKQRNKTIENLIEKLMREEKGAEFSGKEIQERYGLKQNIGRAIDRIRVLGEGNFKVTWNNKLLINNLSILRVKDGIITINQLSLTNGKIGFQIYGPAIKAKVDGIIYNKLFLNDNYIYGMKSNNQLTSGYTF